MLIEMETRLETCHELMGGAYETIGYDSEIYPFGPDILKVYNRSRDEFTVRASAKNLALYRKVTNEASEIAVTEGLKIELPFTRKSYPLLINPINRMFKCSHCGYVEAFSKYIPGENLKYCLYEFDPDELSLGLTNLSEKLNTRLNVKGVDLILINIKRLPDGALIATDLCSDLTELRSI